LGVLWKEKLTPDAMLHHFYGHITRGVQDILGLTDVQPLWPACGPGLATRAVWTSPDRAITLIGLGESIGAQTRHPPLDEIAAARLDGVITASIISEEFIGSLLKLGIHTVLADHLNERFALNADQVFVDPLPAHRAAVRYLVGEGLKRIHFIGGFTSIPAPSPAMSHEDVAAFRQGRMQIDPDSMLRMGAWRLGMQECGLAAPERWAHFENPWFVKNDALAKKLLALPTDDRPEAVICHNIEQAQSLMEIFAEHGARLTAVGVTDRGYGGPALLIRAYGRELGASAAELLISRLYRPSRLQLRVGVPMVFVPPERAVQSGALSDADVEMAAR
jgi:DNA-binding LacI/PurR family transcriptional regulator